MVEKKSTKKARYFHRHAKLVLFKFAVRLYFQVKPATLFEDRIEEIF